MSQQIKKEIKEEHEEQMKHITPEERQLMDRVVDHAMISKDEVIKAAEIMFTGSSARRW